MFASLTERARSSSTPAPRRATGSESLSSGARRSHAAPAAGGPRWAHAELAIRPGDGSPDEDEALFEPDQDALVPDVFEHLAGRRGPHIRVSGGVPGGTTRYPDGIRWLQTIDTNVPLFGQSPPYVDFIPPRDDKPFYFSDAGETRSGGTFSDNPSRNVNNVRWDATLSLAGVRGRNVTRIDSMKYGFTIDGAGTVSIRGPSNAGVADIVIHGDTLRSEYPDWSFSGGFAVPQVTGRRDLTGAAEAAA